MLSEGKSEVKERLGWVAISDTSWARLRGPVSVQESVSHMDTLSPALHCGSCLKGAGAGRGCGGSPCGKEAEKAKPHRGSYLCRSWGWWWDGGDGGAGAAGAAVLVTVPDSTALSQQSQGQRTGTGRGRESASLGITWAVERKPCGIWPLLRDPGGGRAGPSLALGKWLLLGPVPPPRSVHWKRLDRRKELHLLPDSSRRGLASSEKAPTCSGWVTYETLSQRAAGDRTGGGRVRKLILQPL